MQQSQEQGWGMLVTVKSEQRRRAILAEIARLGPVVPGNLSQRSTTCAGAGCRCRADPPMLHGPYPTWTHQVNGRQVTKTLSVEEAEELRPAIQANRRLRELVKELEALSSADFESRLTRK
ncbi:MAG: DUF6788 family protein [Acidimicrobiales bacterium]